MMQGSSPSARSIVLLACAGFASMASMRACDALLPELAREFDASTGQTAQVITAFAAAYGLLQLVYGPLGDRYGKYRVIAWAALACALGSVGVALAPSLPSMVVFRALTGAASAGIIPLSMAWVGDAVPYERRQETLARMLAGATLGLAAGQFMSGLLADTVGWRWTFVILAAVYVAVGLLLRREAARQAVASPVPGVSDQARAGFAAQISSVLRTTWSRIILAVVFIEGVAVFGALTFVPSYLHTHFDLPLTAAGSVVAVFALGALIYILGSRQLVASLGERGLTLAGGAILCAAFVALTLAPAWGWAVPAMIAVGGGYYMLHNTLQTAATQMAPHARGTAVSLFASSLFLGQSIGVVAASALVESASVFWAFGLSAVVLLGLGSTFSLLLGRRSRP